MSRPLINEMVHYVARGSADGKFPPVCRAAIVTEKDEGENPERVGLAVVNPTGLFFHPLDRGPDGTEGGILFDQPKNGLTGGTWHYTCGE